MFGVVSQKRHSLKRKGLIMKKILIATLGCLALGACADSSTGTVGGAGAGAVTGAVVGGPVGAVVGGTIGAAAGSTVSRTAQAPSGYCYSRTSSGRIRTDRSGEPIVVAC